MKLFHPTYNWCLGPPCINELPSQPIKCFPKKPNPTRVSIEVSNYWWLVSWFITYFAGLTTYLYNRGYNPFTKYHGHPSTSNLADQLRYVSDLEELKDPVEKCMKMYTQAFQAKRVSLNEI